MQIKKDKIENLAGAGGMDVKLKETFKLKDYEPFPAWEKLKQERHG